MYHLLAHERLSDHYVRVAGADKHAFYTSKRHMWGMERIGLSTKTTHTAIALDIDGGDPLTHIDQAMPAGVRPNFMAGKWMTSHAWQGKRFSRPHIVFHLANPVWKADRKQMQLFEIVTEAIRQRLEAVGCIVDPNRPVTVKNPLIWDTETFGDEFENKRWTLHELAQAFGTYDRPAEEFRAAIKARRAATRKNVAKGDDAGRNQALFNRLCPIGYTIGDGCNDYAYIYDQLMHEAQALNESMFHAHEWGVLGPREVKETVRSIAAYCASKDVYTPKGGNDKDRGAAAAFISDRDSLKKRQQTGAYYTANKKTHGTVRELREIVDQLRENGEPITKKGLARASRKDINTIRKYWDAVINGADVESPAAAQLEATRTAQTVIDFRPQPQPDQGGELGVHQEYARPAAASKTVREAAERIRYRKPKQLSFLEPLLRDTESNEYGPLMQDPTLVKRLTTNPNTGKKRLVWETIDGAAIPY